MRKLFAEFRQFSTLWFIYISRRLRFGFWHFERFKDLLVVKLIFGRGKLARPFMHSGMAVLVILGLALAPMIASSYPGFAKDPWQETPPSSAVLSAAMAPDETSTMISDKKRAEIIEYKVAVGDTVSSIAQKFDVSVDTIRWANDLKSIAAIKPGQTLQILPVSGILHKVAKGETIYSIAKHYSTEPQNMVDFPYNTFVNDETFALAVGQTVIVPDGVMPKEVPWSPKATYIARQTPDAGAVSAVGSFVWPTTGIISQGYRWYHQAIDIANRAAPAVLAADAGTVVQSGWTAGGFGNRVLIDHGNGYKTNYAHMQKIYVTVGQTVNRGDQLGQMGSTGRSTGTHLDFRIYRNGAAVDPLSLLK